MQNKIRVAVLVSGGGTNLQALIDEERGGKVTDSKIVLVVSDKKDAFALTRARNAGIPTLCIEKKVYRQEEFEEKLLHALAENNIELIVLAGFLCILSSDFTSRYKKRILNVHPSLIPAFCGKGFYGLKVHRAALDRGVKITGATVHFVNEIPDGGEIILQRAVRVLPGDTPDILQKRVMEEAEWKILPEAVQIVSARMRMEKRG